MTEPPLATVVIRSFKRLDEVRALLAIVFAQTYPRFEVLVVDSTPGLDETAVKLALDSRDSRLRVVHTPPAGCAAAANAAVREARGDVLVFVDDDDVPLGDDWLGAHMRNYADPHCLGVNGYMIFGDEYRAGRAVFARLRFARMLTLGFFKQPRCYAYDDSRKSSIDFLLGGNSSIRREAAIRAGGWDEFMPIHNEYSLFLRLRKRMSAGEYLAYDPEPKMKIRKDVPGGIDYRSRPDIVRHIDLLARYYLWVVGREHPWRVYGLLPAFVPSFTLFAAVAGYELASGRDVNPYVELLRGAAYAPVSLAKHFVKRAPPAFAGFDPR